MVKYIVGRMARRRGENAEQRAARLLKADGWVVGRMRRGPIDVIAAKEGRILLVQVKSGKARVKRTELESMVQWGIQFNGDVEVWHFRQTRVARRRVHASRRVVPIQQATT